MKYFWENENSKEREKKLIIRVIYKNLNIKFN